MTFTARGRITFDNVVFVIEAADLAEAWVKAVAVDIIRCDLNDATLVDRKIRPDTLESHE